MEDRSKQLDDVQRELKTGSGSLLSNARKEQNRTVEEIADELNLSVSQIKTIELDQSEGLPEPTYVRGYIRSYAKLLGLDAEVVLKNYLNPNWQKSSSLEDLPRGIGSAEKTTKKTFLTPAKVIVFLSLIALIAFLWFSGIAANTLGLSSRGVPAEVEQTANNSDSRSTVSASRDDESNDGAAEDDVVAETSAATDGDNAGTPPSDDDGQNELVLNFAQTSWVDIRDAQDKRLAYKSFAEGEVLRVTSEKSMSVFIGNAEGVTVQYNGEQFDISEYREGVYAKFTLEGDVQ